MVCIIYEKYKDKQRKGDEICWICTCVTENKNAYSVLVAKSEQKRALGRYERNWKNSVKIGRICVCVDWIKRAQDRVTRINLRFALKTENFLTGWATGDGYWIWEFCLITRNDYEMKNLQNHRVAHFIDRFYDEISGPFSISLSVRLHVEMCCWFW
jgi:hypothetical protein